MALIASTVFFFLERDRVSAKWKTSLTVSGLVTLVAAVHYFYMRDVWVATGSTPTVFRYIDWLIIIMCFVAAAVADLDSTGRLALIALGLVEGIIVLGTNFDKKPPRENRVPRLNSKRHR